MTRNTFSVHILHARQGPLLNMNNAVRVDCRISTGEVGIMAGHVPWEALLLPGWIRVHTARREHALLARGGLVRFFSSGKLVSVVEDVFDADHADAAALRARVEELQARRPFPPEEASRMEQEISWLLLCLEAVEKHLIRLDGDDDEETEEE